MKAKLRIYLKGLYYESVDIEYPENSVSDNFEDNCKFKEVIIQEEIKLLEIHYARQIVKCNHEVQFVLVIESKMDLEF